MNELLKKDLTMKIISILFALIIWFVVLDNVNPYISKSLNIPITVENEASLQSNNIIVAKDFSRYVSISIKGREDQIKNVSASDFIVKLDFSKIKGVEDNVVKLDGPYYIGKEDISESELKIDMNPSSVNLVLEPIRNNSFKVVVETTGNWKEGYQIVEETTKPEMITIQAPDSILKTVGSVKAIVDVTDLDRDLSVQQECKVYDKKGKEIEQLSRNLSVVVNVVMAKQVTVTPVIKGKPAPNYTEVSQKANPETVLITGDPTILSHISELVTAPVNIEDIKSSVSLSGKIVVPYGVKLYDSPANINVIVTIEPLITKEFTVGINDIDLANTEIDNSLNYLIQTDNTKISIKGPQSNLNTLDIKSIHPYIDVVGLAEGSYKLPLKFTLPDTCRISGDYMIDVLIQKRG